MATLYLLMTAVCLFLYLNRINASIFNKTEESSRIVGGAVTTIDKAKFVVYFRSTEKFLCGGALVTPKFVITAAHCLEEYKASDLTVVGGATYLTDKGVRSSVSNIFVHKKYEPKSLDMDIAVLKLSRDMKGTNVSTIKLCNLKWKAHDFITVYGWGQTSENIIQSSHQLRTVSVPIVEHKKCRDLYKDHKITPAMFCAGDLKGKDACSGDSGGPAVYKNQLCGVVSWGLGCARDKYPGVYTDVMYVKDFLNKVMSTRAH